MSQNTPAYWSVPLPELFQQLQAVPQGLTSEIARERQALNGSNLLKPRRRTDTVTLLIGQFKSPIIIILVVAAGLSFFLHDSVDALIVLAIVVGSGFLGFWQERGAADAVEKLLAIVQVKALTLRDGAQKEIPAEEIVPGDIVVLAAGRSIPGDCRLLESQDLFVDEAMLTGETYPVEKTVGVIPEDTPLAKRTNVLFMGTHVVSGIGKALVVRTGKGAEFGKVSERLKLRLPETEFERGIRRFGYFLMEVTLVLVIAIFAVNVYLQRPVLESFLFSLALAVGLTPQLLPAIISINLAHGAKRMAIKKVIVKRLASIENFGSMNVLCSDKTGTLTEGKVGVHAAVDVDGKKSERVLFHAFLNASFETGFTNPIDKAIRACCQFDLSAYQKLDEVPYDFIRKRLSILVAKGDAVLMVTKGSVKDVLAVCSDVETSEGARVGIAVMREGIQQRFEEFSRDGYRTLGIACREAGSLSPLTKEHEAGMTFLGFLVLSDMPKPGIAQTIARLKDLGVSLKIVTGDNRLVASRVSQEVGLSSSKILTGTELHQLSDEALLNRISDVDVFAEVEPNQKERIILALRKAGKVVGYMGDGINDASALHAADVGISVDDAVDVAKEAADFVLLERDLNVLVEGVKEGRTTFANTLKYVFMATSANFGNMFSMAGASLFLPFLPLLPKQILLTNLMTDFPEMAIAGDSVDAEMVEQPRRWDIKFIRKFMLTFGIVSSFFDYLTFGVLLIVLHATPAQFRTGWFMESVISAAVIVLIIRSRKPLHKSRPSKPLLAATLLVVFLAAIFPFLPLGTIFGFRRLPPVFFYFLGTIVIFYIIIVELTKKVFYRMVKF